MLTLTATFFRRAKVRTFKIISKALRRRSKPRFLRTMARSVILPPKFRVIGGGYSADGEKVFSEREEFLPGTVDAATFERVGSSDFFKDKNHVYMDDSKLSKGADSATFEYLPSKSYTNAKNFLYAKDKAEHFLPRCESRGLRSENA